MALRDLTLLDMDRRGEGANLPPPRKRFLASSCTAQDFASSTQIYQRLKNILRFLQIFKKLLRLIAVFEEHVYQKRVNFNKMHKTFDRILQI